MSTIASNTVIYLVKCYFEALRDPLFFHCWFICKNNSSQGTKSDGGAGFIVLKSLNGSTLFFLGIVNANSSGYCHGVCCRWGTFWEGLQYRKMYWGWGMEVQQKWYSLAWIRKYKTFSCTLSCTGSRIWHHWDYCFYLRYYVLFALSFFRFTNASLLYSISTFIRNVKGTKQ